MIRFVKRRTPEEVEALIKKYAKRRPHEEKAIRAFGERIVYELRAIANEARVYPGAERRRRLAEAHLEAALFVADHLEQARHAPRPLHRDDVFSDEMWRDVAPLIGKAIDLVKEHAQAVSTFLGAEARGVGSHATSGRPTERRRFIEMAREKYPEAPREPAAWAHLSIAVGLDDPEDDFEHVRKTYADLLKNRRRTPGKPGAAPISRAREKRSKT